MTRGVDAIALRRDMRARRSALPPSVRLQAAADLASRLSALGFERVSGNVAGYWAVDGEIALHLWQTSQPRGVTYCLPLIDDDRVLRFAPWSPGDPLVSNRFGIPEPDVEPNARLSASDMDLIVVPLVAFDSACNRIGMGGGWYDRTLGALEAPRVGAPFAAGAGYELQRVATLVPQPWDVRLDAICTDAATYVPGNAGQ